MNRIFLSLGIFLCCAFVLSACSGPGAMPRGYGYHDERYKSPDPGPTSKISDAEREVMTADQAKQVRRAVHDLTRRLTDRAGLAPKPVFVQTADPLSPFYAMIDNDLRDVLTHIGYRLSASPDGSYIMQYDAEKLDRPASMKDTPHTQPNVMMTIRVIDEPGRDGRVLTEESDEFFIEGAERLSLPGTHFPLLQKAGE